MFLGVDYFWVAFPVGFGGGMPLAIALAKYYESEREADRGREREGGHRDRGRSDEADAALAELRDRYARGELGDEEFEARVERLLETESVDDAETFLGVSEGDRSTERERA
ncbi:SHOCT domain-containing protein [Halosimplex litoreum]|uniref:SHOCT domain-containing protein n=2 Tax=Halosimplex litoreum TaxID=1198301 RepID=A0A7U3WBN7_9EURY|nr:SHOCT domain-containing protein [Halosimplex litoreum]